VDGRQGRRKARRKERRAGRKTARNVREDARVKQVGLSVEREHDERLDRLDEKWVVKPKRKLEFKDDNWGV
jgi:hypothetical protein